MIKSKKSFIHSKLTTRKRKKTLTKKKLIIQRKTRKSWSLLERSMATKKTLISYKAAKRISILSATRSKTGETR